LSPKDEGSPTPPGTRETGGWIVLGWPEGRILGASQALAADFQILRGGLGLPPDRPSAESGLRDWLIRVVQESQKTDPKPPDPVSSPNGRTWWLSGHPEPLVFKGFASFLLNLVDRSPAIDPAVPDGVSDEESPDRDHTFLKERYDVLVEHSQDGVFLAHEGRYLYVNQTYADMLGYSRGEMEGSSFLRFIAPEEHTRMQEIWREREAGRWEKSSYEMYLLKKDGKSRILASVRSGPIFFNGKLSSTGTIRDITAERNAARALRKIERDYQAIFENSLIGIYQSLPEGRFRTANESLARMLGYGSAHQLVEQVQNIANLFVDPADRLRLNQRLESDDQVTGYELRLRRRDGTLLYAEASSRSIRHKDGSLAYYEGSLVDVTERKQAEAALMRSEMRYRTLVENSHVGVFILEKNRCVYVNESFARMLGREPGQLVGLVFRDLVLPELRSVCDECLGRLARAESTVESREWSLVHRDPAVVPTALVSMQSLVTDLGTILMGTSVDITERKRIEARLLHQAGHDPLTALPNRVLFSEQLDQAIRDFEPDHRPYAVLLFEVDTYQLVNDSLGYVAGDELLVRVAQRLEQTTGPQAFVSRLEGSEFALLLSVKTVAQVRATVEQIRQSFSRPFTILEREVFTQVHMGIVWGEPSYQDSNAVLRDADTALSVARLHSDTGYALFDRRMRQDVVRRLNLESELRAALIRQEFRVLYQPVVELDTGRMVGVEALLRWQRRPSEQVSPQVFLSIAEEIGLIIPIGIHCLQQICETVVRWKREYPSAAELVVNFNLSHRQFVDPLFWDLMSSVLSESRFPPKYFQVEITENVLLGQDRELWLQLEKLLGMGAKLALDDFGTGYSSLSYLHDLPLSSLKIDRSFTLDLEDNPRHQTIVQAILRLANDLNFKAIVEGIEELAQLRALQKAGARFGQGYYFAPALTVPELEAGLAEGACFPRPVLH
jgi:Amt family ammonium transporter